MLLKPKRYRAKNKQCPLVTLNINSHTIPLSQTAKVLGVTFSETLSWNEHVTHVQHKVSRGIGILAKHRHTLPTAAKLLIYNSVIMSHIHYCHLVWGKTSQQNIQSLFILQKRALRIVANTNYDAHTDPLFKKFQIIKANYTYSLALSKLYIKALKLNNDHILHLIHLTPHIRSYPSRSVSKWKIPSHRTSYALQSLTVTTPHLFNELLNIGIDLNSATYRKIKAHFINKQLI